jgi:hypothetical protein
VSTVEFSRHGREDPAKPVPLLTRKQLLFELTERGYPITESYWNKINLPSVGSGPPVFRFFGKRPLYRLEDGIAWAESRCTTARSKLVA